MGALENCTSRQATRKPLMMVSLKIYRVITLAVLVLLLDACASLPDAACGPATEFAVRDTMYFGTGIPGGGIVTADDWSMFLTATVTPRFPQGLTVSQAAGQWRGDDGAIVQETSYVLELVHADDIASEQAVADIVSAYKTQFSQEAVLRVSTNACISF